MDRWLSTVLLCLTACTVWAQADAVGTWQQVYEELVGPLGDAADADTDADADTYDLLEHLAAHPIDLNTATVDELEALPFLSSQQVMDLVEHRDRYRGFSSVGELRMVGSLDFLQLQLLPFFVSIEPTGEEKHFPKLENIVKHSRHTLTATARVPFYDRRGDVNGYLGYKYRHWTKYELSYGDYVRIGLTGSQDAGEPFMAGGNAMGYDLYNYYLQVQRMGCLENLVAGKYKVSMGMGLVMGTSFALGKMATLQSLGRTTRTLRPHGSRSEADYLHGAAATLRLARPLCLTVFASRRAVDATLAADGTATTLSYSGYHRTPAEMQKKHNTRLTAGGASLALRRGPLHAAANVVYTHTDRSLEPDRTVLYRRYYAHGDHFLNLSLDYGYRHPVLALSGETAADREGHLACIHALSIVPADNLSLVVLHRFYSYRYTSLYGHSFGESTRPQNENGLYVGATWRPAARWQLQAYADYATFPWARYQVSLPSHTTDLLLQSTYQRRTWSLQVRYRAHLRQKDNADKTALTAADDHRLRLQLTLTPAGEWSAATRAELVATRYKETARGWLLAQQVGWKRRWLALQLTAAGFDTDSYQARVYLYEPHLQGDFAYPVYYGEGLRAALMARADAGRHLRLSLRLGHTRYFDRDAVGTGLQQTPHRALTDLDLQLRWCF